MRDRGERGQVVRLNCGGDLNAEIAWHLGGGPREKAGHLSPARCDCQRRSLILPPYLSQPAQYHQIRHSATRGANPARLWIQRFRELVTGPWFGLRGEVEQYTPSFFPGLAGAVQLLTS